MKIVIGMAALVAMLIGLWTGGFGAPVFAADKGDKSSCCMQCNSCQKMCEKTLEYCKKKGGKHADAKHIRIMTDCIATCKMNQDFAARGSELQPKMAALCAEACRLCAESCEALKDPQMKDCVEECKKCSKSCESMSTGAACHKK